MMPEHVVILDYTMYELLGIAYSYSYGEYQYYIV